MTAARHPIEIELKLAMAPAHARALRAQPDLRHAAATRRVTPMLNIYFDTPSRQLHAGRMALRLRRAGRRWLQALKCASGGEGAMQQRGEWEQAVPGAELDLSLLRDSPLARLPGAGMLHTRLAPVFSVEFRRSTWQVSLAGGTCVEVALDQGTLRAGENVAALCEVEIELVRGEAAQVFDLAARLGARIPLMPEPRSKAARGFALVDPLPDTPRRGQAIDLGGCRTVAQAMSAIVAACLSHLQANLPGVRAGRDEEFLHQARAAVRRLRLAARLFAADFPPGVADDLAWLGHALGRARDRDVLRSHTLPALHEALGDALVDAREYRALCARAERERLRDHRAAKAVLDSARTGRLLLALTRLAFLPPDPASPPLGRFATRALRRAHRTLADAADDIAGQSDEERHRLRRRARRLHDLLYFLDSLLHAGDVRRVGKRLDALQDLLGAGNDDVVGERLIRAMTPAAALGGTARGWFAARAAGRVHAVERALARLPGVPRVRT